MVVFPNQGRKYQRGAERAQQPEPRLDGLLEAGGNQDQEDECEAAQDVIREVPDSAQPVSHFQTVREGAKIPLIDTAIFIERIQVDG